MRSEASTQGGGPHLKTTPGRACHVEHGTLNVEKRREVVPEVIAGLKFPALMLCYKGLHTDEHAKSDYLSDSKVQSIAVQCFASVCKHMLTGAGRRIRARPCDNPTRSRLFSDQGC
eukprot:6212839-Pleurochrysis_carterae.AAC.10